MFNTEYYFLHTQMVFLLRFGVFPNAQLHRFSGLIQKVDLIEVTLFFDYTEDSITLDMRS